MTYQTIKQYSLIDDGTATSVFSAEESAVLNEVGSARKRLLSSGFNSSSIDYSYPVSAALQLNGDLTSLSDEQLKQFADAELEKYNRISFRSYDVDADYRVCVIADSVERLDAFLDTYGGVLEIEPLLIGPFHPDYATLQEIDISPASKGYTVNYTIKSPVNRPRCNYCGICGAICPEQCILENLHFDFSRCTFCTDCEKACPVEAIDLHSIERISLEIPAIIVLGEPAFTEPADTGFLYREAHLPEFFSSIFACKVDEVITCDHSICHFNGTGEAGCTICLSACQYGAVKGDGKEIKVDAYSCTECGICASVCPTGALQNQKLTDQMFIDFFRTFEMPMGSRVIIGSDKSLHSFWWSNNQKQFGQSVFLEIPGSHSFSLMNLLFLVSNGARQVLILADEDLSRELEQTVNDANLFCKKVFGIDEVVKIGNDYRQIPEEISGPESFQGKSRYKDLSFVNRRRKLSSLVHFLGDLSSSSVQLDRGEVKNWATIVCDDEKCTQCLACLNVCKIESLSADQKNLSLCWHGGLCIACSGCVATCPEQALTLKSSVELTDSFFTDQEISRAEPMRCKDCGKVFGTKKSFDRVMAVLTEKQGAPPDHLQYCEDCRVMKLMESE